MKGWENETVERDEKDRCSPAMPNEWPVTHICMHGHVRQCEGAELAGEK